MCELDRLFLAMLRAGLWNQVPSEECFCISEEEWKQIYRMACAHTVEGIVYDGVMLLPVDSLPSAPLLIQWTAGIDRLERRNENMNRVIEELDELFAANGLYACLMKGQGVAACYANPLHRVCGDVDWYFSHEEFVRAHRLIADKGVPVRSEAGFSVSYVWKGVLVEHHDRLLDLHNPLLYGYLKQLLEEEKVRAGSLPLSDRKVKLPSPLLMHVLVNAHILKHMLAFGIGLRQLCDSARVCYAFHRVNENKLDEVYRKAGVLRWMHMLGGVLVTYLGLPPEYLPFSLPVRLNIRPMIQDVLSAGNFGFYDKRCNKEETNSTLKREKAWQQVTERFMRYAPYAPCEACWFPVMQVYSHFKKWGVK